MTDVSNMSEDEKQMRKKLGIPMGASLQLIDMDANPDKYERKTAGWTDEQIKNKTVAEFDAMINSAQLAIENLEDTVREQKERAMDLQRIRGRRVELGG